MLDTVKFIKHNHQAWRYSEEKVGESGAIFRKWEKEALLWKEGADKKLT
ncbi:hypothetical protein [Adhaeribacter soli]|nr:hypothetical protein [Adhaeribacter soli]